MLEFEAAKTWLWLPLALAGAIILYRGLGPRSRLASLRLWPRWLLRSTVVLAALVLWAQLGGPVWTTRTLRYSDPAVVIATDHSGSVEAGAFFHAQAEFRAMRKAVAGHYRALGFDIIELDFTGKVALHTEGDTQPRGDGASVTDLFLLERYCRDSLGTGNLQAIFLLSDGRHTFPPSRRELPRFGARVFPIRFGLEKFLDLQLEEVRLRPDTAKGRDRWSALVRWRLFGSPQGDAEFALSDGRVTLAVAAVDPVSGREAGAQLTSEIELRSKGMPAGGTLLASLRLVEGDANPHNDTLRIAGPAGDAPVKWWFENRSYSPDVHWMVRYAREGSGKSVAVGSLEDVLKKTPDASEGVQVWVAVERVGAVREKLAAASNRHIAVVVHGAGPASLNPDTGPEEGALFDGEAWMRTGAGFGKWFSNIPLPLAALGVDSLWAAYPRAVDNCALQVAEGERVGCLAYSSGPYFRFALEDFWPASLGPNAPGAAKEFIRDAVVGMAGWVAEAREAREIILDSLLLEGQPFQFALKHQGVGEGARLQVRLAGGDEWSRTSPLRPAAAGVYRSDSLRLPAGRFHFQAARGDSVFWSDTLEVLSLATLEMRRTGPDWEALERLARESQGEMLQFRGSPPSPTGGWPELFSGQVREQERRKVPLYNTPTVFALVGVLLALYWIGRKAFSLE